MRTTSFETKIKSVLEHFKANGKITSWDAINLYRATRLSAIVFVLKKRGHEIHSRMEYDTNTKSRWAVYTYSKPMPLNTSF